MAVLLLLMVTQIVAVLASKCPEGQIKHNFCCMPVWNCKDGYYIQKCEREGAEDKCIKCPRGTHNPFNSSSFDIKKCYKKICKLIDSVAVSDTHCECDRSNGWFGENSLACQLKHGGCPAGEELTQKGRCERCTNFHYKDWDGSGFCKKHFDCSQLQMDEYKGNSTHGSKCFKKGMTHKTMTTTTPTRTSLMTTSTTASTTTKATTTKEAAITNTIRKATREQPSVLVEPTQSPTKVSRKLPIVGNHRGSSRKEVVGTGRIEGILIVVVAILCFLLLVVVCIGTIAYLRRRLKPSADITIPNRPALPLPSPQNEHLPDVFAPPIYQTQRQTQPLLPQENPYLCMSNPNHSCIYALPAAMHLNSSHSVNYPQSRSPVFDTVSTYGLHYVPPPNRQMSTASPNSLGSQLTLQPRNEHLYMTLPAERSEATAPAAAATMATHQESMKLENRNSTTENFYEFP